MGQILSMRVPNTYERTLWKERTASRVVLSNHIDIYPYSTAMTGSHRETISVFTCGSNARGQLGHGSGSLDVDTWSFRPSSFAERRETRTGEVDTDKGRDTTSNLREDGAEKDQCKYSIDRINSRGALLDQQPSASGGANHTVLCIGGKVFVAGDNEKGQLPAYKFTRGGPSNRGCEGTSGNEYLASESFYESDIDGYLRYCLEEVYHRIKKRENSVDASSINESNSSTKMEISKFQPKNVSCGWEHTAVVFECGCCGLFGDNRFYQLGYLPVDNKKDGPIKGHPVISTSLFISPSCAISHNEIFKLNYGTEKLIFDESLYDQCTHVAETSDSRVGIKQSESSDSKKNCICGFRVSLISTELMGISKVSSTSLGTYTTILLDEDSGTISGCGWNKFGELGSTGLEVYQSNVESLDLKDHNSVNYSRFIKKPRTKGALVHIPSPIIIPSIFRIKSVACGHNHTIIMSEKNESSTDYSITFWGLGRNHFGQLMTNPKEIKETCTPLSIPLSSLSRVAIGIEQNDKSISHHDSFNRTRVITSWNNSFILLKGERKIHQVLGFGRAQKDIGILIPDSSDNDYVFVPKLISLHVPELLDNDGCNIEDIAAGSEHILAIVSTDKIHMGEDGKEDSLIIDRTYHLLSFGWNEHGNCGIGEPCNVEGCTNDNNETIDNSGKTNQREKKETKSLPQNVLSPTQAVVCIEGIDNVDALQMFNKFGKDKKLQRGKHLPLRLTRSIPTEDKHNVTPYIFTGAGHSGLII